MFLFLVNNLIMLYFYQKNHIMKKIYLSVLGLASFTFVNAQFEHYDFNQTISTVHLDESKNILPSINFKEKTLGKVVWTNVFDNPSVDWDVNNSGKIGANLGWSFVSNATADVFNPKNATTGLSEPINIKSTSKGTFAQVVNGPSGANEKDVTYTLTTKKSIDVTTLAGTGKVNLSFQQYGARYHDLQEVYVSTNGTDYVKVGDNNDIPSWLNGSGFPYNNPTTKTIDLSSVLSTGASTVWIRFSWTVDKTYPPNYWYAYGWMIDDVSISTKPDNDLILNEVIIGSDGNNQHLSYYQIPSTQVHPIKFGAVVTNNGLNTQSDIVFNATTTSYTGKSEIGLANPYGELHGTLSCSKKDTLWTSVPFTPPSIVSSIKKTMAFNVSSSVSDEISANNGGSTFNYDFYITKSIYARDNNKPSSYSYFSNGGYKYEHGNVFDIFADQKLYYIDVFLDPTTVEGSIFRVKVYEFDSNGVGDVPIAQSDDYSVLKKNIGAKVSLELGSYPLLQANKSYLAVVSTDGVDGKNLDVVIRTCGRGFSMFKSETDVWYEYNRDIPMIRMNFLNDVGLSELENVEGFNVYPNPANLSTTISYELTKETKVAVNVTDITGKSVYSNDFGKMSLGKHLLDINTDSMSNGIYIVNFEANGITTSQKLVVKK